MDIVLVPSRSHSLERRRENSPRSVVSREVDGATVGTKKKGAPGLPSRQSNFGLRFKPGLGRISPEFPAVVLVSPGKPQPSRSGC